MTTKPKPHIHGRDHEHGGADPTLIHWEDVGGAGGAGAGLPTIKGVFDGEPPSSSFLIGGEGDDAVWTYMYELPHSTLLYVDADGYITRDDYDADASRGSLYLVVASARLSGLADSGGGDPDATLLVHHGDTNAEITDKRVSILSEVWLQRSLVVSGFPVSEVRVSYGGDFVPSCQATLSVTLIHPGPVPPA